MYVVFNWALIILSSISGAHLIIHPFALSHTAASAAFVALALIGITVKPERPATPLLPDTEQKIWDTLRDGVKSTDELPDLTGLTLAECLAAITSLEIMGLIECTLAGEIRRR